MQSDNQNYFPITRPMIGGWGGETYRWLDLKRSDHRLAKGLEICCTGIRIHNCIVKRSVNQRDYKIPSRNSEYMKLEIRTWQQEQGELRIRLIPAECGRDLSWKATCWYDGALFETCFLRQAAYLSSSVRTVVSQDPFPFRLMNFSCNFEFRSWKLMN